MREVPILGEGRPGANVGAEWLKASCTGEDCDRTWDAKGTQASRAAMKRAQKHSDRTGHHVSVEWANRR